MTRGILPAAVALAGIGAAGTANADETAAQRFGAREDVRQISLSPDGRRAR